MSPASQFNSFLTTIETWLKPIANYFLEWRTSSFVEGFNNPFKFLKRRYYGIFDVGHLFQRLTLDINGYERFSLSLPTLYLVPTTGIPEKPDSIS